MNQENKEQDARSKEISIKELYPSLVQLIIHDETITWHRFSNFLLFNSILILAWVTIYRANLDSALNAILSLIVLIAIGILGIISGIYWSLMGKRGRAFLNEHVDQASVVEDKFWGEELQTHEVKKPLKIAKKIREEHPGRFAGSYYILHYGPWIFVILHIILLFISILKIVRVDEVLNALSPYLRFGGS